jgi:hypothetical protein
MKIKSLKKFSGRIILVDLVRKHFVLIKLICDKQILDFLAGNPGGNPHTRLLYINTF